MNIRRYISIVLALLLTVCSVSAQESSPRQIYEQAEEAYQIGRIVEAKQIVEGCIKNLTGTHRLAGYRLLSLCCLALDQTDEARHYAELVLKENPYYTPTVEYPPRFLDMISDIKQGIITTISTASSQEESINEAPVPITIITAEMIEELGYNKNLNQILAAYVPGIAEVASEDPGDNLVMHSAYASGQEYILIMENGHRLNSHFDNNGVTSYSISTEKIDHIEVLRGPASSLYGNVALSAVVNIITKSGRNIDGVKARYGYGSYNTHRADLLAGTQYMDVDVSAWASIYKSDGQIRHFADGEGYYADLLNSRKDYGSTSVESLGPDRIYVDGYRSPSYDLGFTFKLKGFNLMFNHKKVHKLYQTSYECSYDYDLYPAINGVKPGITREETHAELGYSRQLGKVSLNASLYGDWNTISKYDAEYDSLVYRELAYELDESDDYKYIYDENGNILCDTTYNRGVINFYNSKESTIGGMLKVGTDYRLGNMKGNLLAGCHFEHFSVNSRMYLRIEDFDMINRGHFYYESLKKAGKEDNLSLFVQDKHYFTPQLIMNVGMRYDMIFQQGNRLTAFSPRLALMYVPSDLFSLKLSYAQAFAEVTYYYRYVFEGVFGLEPQRQSAVQLTAMGKVAPLHLNYEVNLFYNWYSNLMYWYQRVNESFNSQGINKGHLSNAGVEITARYTNQRFSGHFNLYYCHDFSAENYYYNRTKHTVTEVPHFTFNLHGAYKLLKTAHHEFKIHGHVSYIGRQLNQTEKDENDYYLKAQTFFDLGVKYSYRQRLKLSLDCENLLNTDRYLCGITVSTYPVFQRGRTLMASIAYSF